jgi:hypothetical protein
MQEGCARVVPVLVEARNDPSSLFFVLLIGKPLHTFLGSTLMAARPAIPPLSIFVWNAVICAIAGGKTMSFVGGQIEPFRSR